MEERIFNDLDEAINNIFLKYQDELGIDSGDIAPLDFLKLEAMEKELSVLIASILDYQK